MALFKVYRGNRDALPETKHDGYAYFCADTGEFFIDVDLKGDGTELNRVQLNALAATKLKNDVKTVEIDDIVLTSDAIVKYDKSEGKVLTLNAVLVGDGKDGVKVIPATLGAFFVNDTDEGPKFDVLPVGAGGLGVKTLAKGGILYGDGTNPVKVLEGTGVLHAVTQGNPIFGTAPITAGGTGATKAEDARTNLDVYGKNDVYTKEEVNAKLKDATTVAYATTLTVAGWTSENDGYVQSYVNAELKCGATHDVPPQVTFTSNRDEYNKIDHADATPGVGIKFYIDEVPEGDINIIVIDHL